MDAWIFAQITNTKENEIPEEVAPFLSLSVIKVGIMSSVKGFFKNVVKKCRDQVVNRISSMFGLGYVALDLGIEVTSAEYIFGVTYEKQTDLRNRKVRILLMRKDQLEELVKKRNNNVMFEHERELAKTPDLTTSGNYHSYAKDRMEHLLKMFEFYHENKTKDSMRECDEDVSPRRGTIIGSVFIASQGHTVLR